MGGGAGRMGVYTVVGVGITVLSMTDYRCFVDFSRSLLVARVL